MGPVDSLNGFREYGDPSAMLLFKVFFPNAFGGTNYSSTPIGAVTHSTESYLSGVENTQVHFGLWAAGKIFAASAWSSCQTTNFQAVGDPFVRR